MPHTVPRIALAAFMLESNGHAAPAPKAEFEATCWLEGDALAADLAKPNPRAPSALSGFIAGMDGGAWEPRWLLAALAGASGPVEQAVFEEVCARIEAGLRAAMPVDGVYLCLHGAATATSEFDPDGVLIARVRAIVGPNIPVIGTLDLHANVSEAMVREADMLISYRTNPHVDMVERGVDAANAMRAMLGGLRPKAAFVKLPLIPPATSQNTDRGPYADIIAYGQSLIDHEILDVSVVSGFSVGDTPKNGMSVIVTARRDQARADAVAKGIAARLWAMRERFSIRLTSLEDATAMALAAGRNAAAQALLFADVADNPGGGGRGNTPFILRAFHEAGVEGAVFGIHNDAALAAAAHEAGKGATIRARFNSAETQVFSEVFEAEAVVEALSDGEIIGRRGIYKGRSVSLGPTALLRIGGIRVVVVSLRKQCAEPAMLEHLGIDLRTVRSLVVKSRGHFRAGFDDIFPREAIVEVDVPGLTAVVLTRVPYQNVPRPIWPLDPAMTWTVPNTHG
jgi:microcystin degradation protein MlrC